LVVYTNVSEEHDASIIRPEDGGSMFLRNIGIYLQVHTESLPTEGGWWWWWFIKIEREKKKIQRNEESESKA
jgi:hypothetical protein